MAKIIHLNATPAFKKDKKKMKLLQEMADIAEKMTICNHSYIDRDYYLECKNCHKRIY